MSKVIALRAAGRSNVSVRMPSARARRASFVITLELPPARWRRDSRGADRSRAGRSPLRRGSRGCARRSRSEEHTSELQSLTNLVCRLLLEKKKNKNKPKQNRRVKAFTSAKHIHQSKS